VGSVTIAGVQPWRHGLGAGDGALEGLQIGPFAKAGLDEAFGLAVGLWAVWLGALVVQAGVEDGLAEQLAAVG
jgi:hypothetical protein